MVWSAALYKGLNWLQYTDGANIVNIIVMMHLVLGLILWQLIVNIPLQWFKERKCSQTHTDYVNKYPSTLQTTSYNFTGTATTPEFCAGVVKASKLYRKNPSQHSADLTMLETAFELEPAFINPKTGKPKEIVCIRVDRCWR